MRSISARGTWSAPGICSRACSSGSRMLISFAPSCIMRCASAGVTDVIVIGSVLLAVELIERGEQHLGPGVSDPVPERLALATEGYEPLVTHLRQMLRQGRLREDRKSTRLNSSH